MTLISCYNAYCSQALALTERLTALGMVESDIGQR
jgi:hypothetical protein